jgi:hypothetical protein
LLLVSGALIGRRRRERDDELDEVRREVFILSFGEGGDVYSVGWVSGRRKGARCIKAGLSGIVALEVVDRDIVLSSGTRRGVSFA